MNNSKITCLILSCLISVMTYAQKDSLSHNSVMLFHKLDTILVRGHRINIPLSGTISNTLKWDMHFMNTLPKILGNADPIHYAQLLPGIQTCNEYDAGLYIQGCDQSQNYVTISSVPLYGVQHLLGFFSIFNSSHFSDMAFTTSRHSASFPNRLGGELDMELPDSVYDITNGELSIGVMSSQGTIRIPVSRNSGLLISARSAYLNLLYKQWLNIDGSHIKYSFGDYNITYLLKPSPRDEIQINTYYGNDNTNITDDGYQADFSLKWGNSLFSTNWNHKFNHIDLRTIAYYTYYHNKFYVKENNQFLKLPSAIGEFGFKSTLFINNLIVGTEIALRNVLPQNPITESTYQIDYPNQIRQKTKEISFFIDYNHNILDSNFKLNVGIRSTFYHDYNNSSFVSADPSVTITDMISDCSNLSISFGTQHQYISQTGFSSIGLPTEFWYSTNNIHKPQNSQYVSASYNISLMHDMYNITSEVYYKRLFNQEEYNGNIMDILTHTYDFNDQILSGSGYNIGINLMLSKRKGPITGWLSYAYSISKRRFKSDELKNLYPSNHDRPHEFNLVSTYNYHNKLELGGTLVFASGTPFTSTKDFYLINNHIVSQFNEHNSNRLSPYFRIDLSINYYIKNTKTKQQAINISFYNVTMHKNDIFYRLKIYKGQYAYKPFHFVLDILPSISYYIKF